MRFHGYRLTLCWTETAEVKNPSSSSEAAALAESVPNAVSLSPFIASDGIACGLL